MEFLFIHTCKVCSFFCVCVCSYCSKSSSKNCLCFNSDSYMPEFILSGYMLTPFVLTSDLITFPILHWSTGRLSDLPDFTELFKSKQFCSEGILAQAAITHYHRLGGLNNNHLFLTVLEAGSSRSGCQHDRDHGKCPLSGLQRTILLCPHMSVRALSGLFL